MRRLPHGVRVGMIRADESLNVDLLCGLTGVFLWANVDTCCRGHRLAVVH